MAIQYAPQNGSILICDYTGITPEMVKRRPVVVLSSVSPKLCLVVPLSTTWPLVVQPWHYFLKLQIPLPRPYSGQECWVKGDMVSAVAFERLNLPFAGKDINGKRRYSVTVLDEPTLAAIRSAVWKAISVCH